MADLVFDEKQHRYSLGDRELVGVTRMLGDMGLTSDWKFPEESRQRGHAVHLACQYVDEGVYDAAGTDPEIRGYVAGYYRVLASRGFTAVAHNVRVCHPGLGVAGTLDVVGLVDGFPEIWDLKSGTLPKAVAIQLAGYAVCLEKRAKCETQEQNEKLAAMMQRVPVRLWRRFSICLDKDGRRPKCDEWSEPQWIDDFLAALRIWHRRKEWGLLR